MIGVIAIVLVLVAVLIGGKALLTRPKQPEYIILPAYTSVYEIEETGQEQIAFPVDIQAVAFDSSKTHLRIQVDANNQTYTGLVEKADLEKRAEAAEEEASEGPNWKSYAFFFAVVIVIITVSAGAWFLEGSFSATRYPKEPRTADIIFHKLESTSGSVSIILHWSLLETEQRQLGFFEVLQRLMRRIFVPNPLNVVYDFIEDECRKKARAASSGVEIAQIEDLPNDTTFWRRVQEKAAEVGIVVRYMKIEVELGGDAMELLKKLGQSGGLGTAVAVTCTNAGIKDEGLKVEVLKALIVEAQADSRSAFLRGLTELVGRFTRLADAAVEGGFLSLIPRALRGGTEHVEET